MLTISRLCSLFNNPGNKVVKYEASYHESIKSAFLSIYLKLFDKQLSL